MRAIISPENKGYAAPYSWACAEFDCTPYLSFFVKLIIEAKDADNSYWGALETIKNMKGPFSEIVLKKSIGKVVRASIPATTTDLIYHKLFLCQTGHVLQDFLSQQVYLEWEEQR